MRRWNVLALCLYSLPLFSQVPEFRDRFSLKSTMEAFEAEVSATEKLSDAAFEKLVVDFLLDREGLWVREREVKPVFVKVMGSPERVRYFVLLRAAHRHARGRATLDLPSDEAAKFAFRYADDKNGIEKLVIHQAVFNYAYIADKNGESILARKQSRHLADQIAQLKNPYAGWISFKTVYERERGSSSAEAALAQARKWLGLPQ